MIYTGLVVHVESVRVKVVITKCDNQQFKKMEMIIGNGNCGIMTEITRIRPKSIFRQVTKFMMHEHRSEAKEARYSNQSPIAQTCHEVHVTTWLG